MTMSSPEKRTGRSRTCRRTAVGIAAAVVFLVAAAGAAMANGASEKPAAGQSAASQPAAGAAPITISFWEAYSGALGDTLAHLVDQFNSSQSSYKVDAVFKGSYPEVMAATVAAVRAHKAPNIAMIFDVGTATMQYSQGVYVPVYKLMKDNNIPFATSDFIAGAASYYSDASGKLNSMPFASSTPVLYYNKDMLAKLGVEPPATWEQLGKVAQMIVSKGLADHGFTTGWPDWSQFEEYAVWNNFPYATLHNGYDGVKGVKVLLNTEPFVKHVQDLADWSKSGAYIYGGRASDGAPLFIDGKVGMYIDSSATYQRIAGGAKFKFGEAPMPYVAGAPGAPQNSVVGGNSLWVIAGAKPEVYAGVAMFLQFLSSANAQSYWGSNTGYVPVSKAGYDALKSSGFYTQHPDFEVAVKELTNKEPTDWSRGIRLGNLPQIRDIEVGALTSVIDGKQSAQAALDQATSQANKVLDDFAAQVGQ